MPLSIIGCITTRRPSMNPNVTVAPRQATLPSSSPVRLVSRFTEGEAPELCETEFHHPQYAPNGRRAVRGKDEGASQAAGAFQWTPVVKVLAAYLLRCAAWARGGRVGLCPELRGKGSSAALSLSLAVSKGNRWICDMFGSDSAGRPFLHDLIKRSNSEWKRKGEDVVLCLDHGPAGLPPEQIHADRGGTLLDERGELEALADAIDGALRPRE